MAQLLSTNVTGNLIVTQNISVANLAVTNPISQLANTGVLVNGTIVANNPNINFASANTSNLVIVGTSNTSPGNVTVTFDTRLVGGNGGSSANANTTTRGITLLIDSISSTDAANAATANSVSWAANVANTAAQTAIALAANAWALANAAQTRVFVAGTSTGNSLNLNFVSSNTSNIVITGTQNTSPGNVTVTFDTRVVGGTGNGVPGGPANSIQFNNGTSFAGTANLTMNTVANTLQLEGNIALGNASAILLGGSSSNTANALWKISYNVTSNSIDFLFI